MTTAFETKYNVIEKIGEGSFSEVLKVEDRVTKIHYAAKKLKKRFKNNQDVLYCAEIIATQKLCRHPNVLYMLEYIYDSLGGKVAFVFELMDMSMYEYMKLKKRLSENKVKLYLYQMLKGLEHLHNNGLFHRDIKPENILVKLPVLNQDIAVFEGELVKLADLGSIRGIYSQPPYTEYISTRWYRSPECLLTIGNYGCKMDVWAVGCVFYEMLTMKPLFPGSNEIDQLSKIHALLGTPSNRLLCKFKKRSKNFENFPHNPGSGLGPLLCNITEDAQNLLKLMLQYDPESRSNVKRLLENKYFSKLRDDDFFRKYKNSEVKSYLLKKGNGDQNYLQYTGSSNNWKNSKFQNTLHGYIIPMKRKPSSPTQPPQQQNMIKKQKSFTKEHAATTGNLRKEYGFTNHKHLDHLPAKPLPAIVPSPPHPLQHRSNQQQKQQNYLSGSTNRIHVLPLTEQILLGQHYSGFAVGGGGGYTYGYGAPGAQGARVPVGQGADTGDRPLKRPVPGAMYSRTTVDLPTIFHHQMQRPTPSTNQQYHHQFNTISRMIKQKPLVKNNADQRSYHNYNSLIYAEQRDRSRNRRNRYNQYTLRGGGSNGSKDSKTKAKSNTSSMTGISGMGLGVTLTNSDKYKYKNESRSRRLRNRSGQRLAVHGKSLREQQRQHEFGVMKAASNPVRISGSTKNSMEVDTQLAHAYERVRGIRNLRKRAASKSPQATPPKHLGATHNYRVSSNSYSSGGTVVSRWSDLKRQSGECHKQLDVAPLPVCRMNIGQSTMYKGYQVLPSVGSVAVGAFSRGVAGGNMFRKTTSNLPQVVKKPLLPQHSQPYSNSAGKREFQSRSFVLPKRHQGRHMLNTIVELKGRGSRKFK